MKKRFILGLLLLQMGNLLLAQNTNRFHLELSSKALFTQYDRISSSPFIGLDIREKVFNYALSINGFWNWSAHWELGLGLGFSNRDAYGICFCHVCDKAVSPPVYTKGRSFDIPLQLRWYWRKPGKKIRPFLHTGLTSEFALLDAPPLEGNPPFQGINTSEYTLNLALGIGSLWQWNEHFSLLIGVALNEYRYFQFSSRDAVMQTEYRAKGADALVLELGLRYTFTGEK